jgi:hypothetical protein
MTRGRNGCLPARPKNPDEQPEPPQSEDVREFSDEYNRWEQERDNDGTDTPQ